MRVLNRSVECGERVDNMQHILSDCRTSYESQRIVLKSEVDGDLTLLTLVSALTITQNERTAIIAFCEYMREKERNENE